ncbi:MAG TPA: GMC family oxidoreductase [Chloroflexi bacterium]|nr:GMC family oxidoreductase [Chloroflexota bacterium]
MIIEARSLPQGTIIETDVCIVGAGTAGITLARELIGQDFRVCLLESGGREPDQATQALYQGKNTGLPYYELDTARARYYGGSSHRWHVALGDNRFGARLRPFDEIDFEYRDWVPHSGWPFAKAHLAPYYDRAQEICQITPLTFAAEDWADSETRPLLPLPNDTVQTIIYKFGRRAPFVRQYTRETERAENITTILYANVLEIETDDLAQNVTGLKAATVEGNRFQVKAQLYVLANGGIEIPRLLLLSNKAQTAGLGNRHDLVGRFFMEHSHFWSGIFVPADADLFRHAVLYSRINLVNDVPIIGKLALQPETIRREKLLNQNIQLMPKVVSRAIEFPDVPVNGRKSAFVNVYRKGRRVLENKVMARGGIEVFVFANMSEQAPNPDSRVCLGEETDIFGQRCAQLDWQVTELDIWSIRRTQEIIGEALAQAGLGRTVIQLESNKPPRNLHGGYHHMGTTRMHANPKEGVVDVNGRVHSLSNLYIAGPSVFPAGGYANPVLTLVALTVRLADHLKKVMTQGAV